MEAIEVNHSQWLNKDQNGYIDGVQWAFKEQRGSFISKSKAVQMMVDYCIKNNIKPEEFIK